jgi:hypothetical protein
MSLISEVFAPDSILARDRINLVNGAIKIQSKPPGGTEISCSVPFASEAALSGLESRQADVTQKQLAVHGSVRGSVGC